MDESTICSGLIRWLETFPGMSGLTVAGLADGVVMGRVLCIIDSNHFTSAWVGRLKQDCGENWRLKVSNLRKIQQTVVDYLQFLNVQYAGQTLPDLTKIGENACPEEVGRMLQLVLACAMNCPDKKRYIQSIMGMPADVQAVVMNTLQTVFMRDASPGVEMTGPASFHPNQRTIAEQLETTTKARDEAVARVHELESQYADVCEKRKYLTEDNARLVERLEGLEDTGEGSTVTTSRYKDLKKKIDSLQDDLFKVETSRDEYRSRVVALEREHGEMVSRTEELQRLADQAHTLQDEVDVLRDMGHRASQAETTIESYKKKLEELSDLRRQHKILEEKNADYMQHILELEEDVKKNDSWRPQLELFKKQVNELRSQLSDETKKADRQSFDNKKLVEKVDAVTIEKDRIAVEREGLKEQLDDLRCQRSAKMTDLGGDISADMLSTDQHQMWEKLMRLQHENERLKKQQRQGAESSEPVLEAMYSELKDQHETVTVENRTLNQRIMELESQVDDARLAAAAATSSPTPSTTTTLSAGAAGWGETTKKELEKRLHNKTDEIYSLRETLVKKDGEMAAMEERYKKYLIKAKSVIKSLDPKYNPGFVPEVATLRQQLHEKERHIEQLEKETEKTKIMRDMEEKLISSAFYNFGMNMHRQMVSQRLSAVEQNQLSTYNLPKPRQGSQRRSNVGNRNSTSSSQLDDGLRYS